jgi:hypothetical protein
MKRILQFGAAVLMALAGGGTVRAQARPLPAADLSKVYDRLLKQIDRIDRKSVV